MAAVLVTVAYGDSLSEEQEQALFMANKEALAVWFGAERPLLKLLLDLVPCCMLVKKHFRLAKLIFPSIQYVTSRSGSQELGLKRKPLKSIN